MKKEDKNLEPGLYDPEIQSLLTKFSDSRNELSKYISEIDDIRKKVDSIFPQGTDFRNKFALEEKIKAASSFFSTILSIRQEYNKSIKEEIELRRKLFTGITDDGEEEENIREIANMVEGELKNKEVISDKESD